MGEIRLTPTGQLRWETVSEQSETAIMAGPYILRRMKTDRKIIADLPDKTEVSCYCRLSKSQIKLYESTVGILKPTLETADGIARRGAVLQSLMRLKQICNHVSAVLYGIGNRLDSQPELLFALRDVAANELITGDISLPDSAVGLGKTIADDQIADIFGVDMDLDVPVDKHAPSRSPASNNQARRKVETAAKQKKTVRRQKTTVAKKKVTKSKNADRKKSPEKSDLTRSNPEITELPQIRPTGKSVTRLRSQLKLSVSEFAELLGVTPASIYRWEKTSGRLKLQSLTFIALAKLYQQACEK